MAKPTIAILSPGDMGAAVARLLIAHDFTILTNVSARSPATQNRAKAAGIHLVETDVDLVNQADIVLSIVPPRDAKQTAIRITTAIADPTSKPTKPLTFVDLNAISPSSAREISSLLSRHRSITFIDGGIIGPPPKLNPQTSTWSKPRIPTSGPTPLPSPLSEALGSRHIGSEIGSASGLKMCFAALSKGFGALALQSFTTAQNLGVLAELREHLEAVNPGGGKMAAGMLTGIPPKAYRWVHEMEEIAATFEADGGFDRDESQFRAVSRIYDFVANGTELGKEVTEDRKRGTTVEDVATLMGEGMARRKVKKD